MGSAIMLLHANLRVKVAGQIPTMNTNLVAQYIVRATAMTGLVANAVWQITNIDQYMVQ